ncbi:L-threonylcarbamoyladenylate synthase [Candidatus Bipolaricaulota sp. J31]
MKIPSREPLSSVHEQGYDPECLHVHEVPPGLIRTAERPIATPSANRFGKTSPTHHEHVLEELFGRIEAVIAAGSTPVGIESTVISLVENPPRVLRPGGTPLKLCGKG